MLTPHSRINTCVAFCVLFLISLGGPQVLRLPLSARKPVPPGPCNLLFPRRRPRRHLKCAM